MLKKIREYEDGTLEYEGFAVRVSSKRGKQHLKIRCVTSESLSYYEKILDGIRVHIKYFKNKDKCFLLACKVLCNFK